jgi:hypothetical protein
VSKPATIEEALKLVSDIQSRLDQSENARIWAQSNAFAHICKDIKGPIAEMTLKAQIVAQKQTIDKQTKIIERYVVEQRELTAKLSVYKSLDVTLQKIKEIA